MAREKTFDEIMEELRQKQGGDPTGMSANERKRYAWVAPQRTVQRVAAPQAEPIALPPKQKRTERVEKPRPVTQAAASQNSGGHSVDLGVLIGEIKKAQDGHQTTQAQRQAALGVVPNGTKRTVAPASDEPRRKKAIYTPAELKMLQGLKARREAYTGQEINPASEKGAKVDAGSKRRDSVYDGVEADPAARAEVREQGRQGAAEKFQQLDSLMAGLAAGQDEKMRAAVAAVPEVPDAKIIELGMSDPQNPIGVGAMGAGILEDVLSDGGLSRAEQRALLTQRQKDVINYLAGSGEAQLARLYYDEIGKEALAARDAEVREKLESDETGVLDGLATRVGEGAKQITANMSAAPDFAARVLAQGARNAITGENTAVTEHAGMERTGQLAANTLHNLEGGALFAGQTLLSVGNNLANYALMGPNAAAMMGVQAGAGSAWDAGQSGATGNQQLLMGVLGGAAEAAGESISLGALEDIVNSPVARRSLMDFAKRVGAQMVTEFTEESATEVMNILADAAVMQDKSQMAQLFTGYLAAHPGAKGEAVAATAAELMRQVGEAGLQGAVSGGLMGSGATALLYGSTNQLGVNENSPRLELTEEQAAQREADRLTLKQQVADNADGLARMGAVKALSTEALSGSRHEVLEAVARHYDELGGSVSRPDFGSVALGKKDVSKSLGYGYDTAKVSAFYAVPEVIQYGKMIYRTEDHKGRGYPTYTFAAPVMMDGKRTNVAVVVRKPKGESKYYVHQVYDAEGSLHEIEAIKKAPSEAHSGDAPAAQAASSQNAAHSTLEGQGEASADVTSATEGGVPYRLFTQPDLAMQSEGRETRQAAGDETPRPLVQPASSNNNIAQTARKSNVIGLPPAPGGAEATRTTLDEFLAKRGLGSPVSDFMLDKQRLPHGQTARQQKAMLKEQQKNADAYASKRAQAKAEYNELLASGKIAEKSNTERLIERANGHPDNESTQAARRVLKKRGIEWRGSTNAAEGTGGYSRPGSDTAGVSSVSKTANNGIEPIGLPPLDYARQSRLEQAAQMGPIGLPGRNRQNLSQDVRLVADGLDIATPSERWQRTLEAGGRGENSRAGGELLTDAEIEARAAAEAESDRAMAEVTGEAPEIMQAYRQAQALQRELDDALRRAELGAEDKAYIEEMLKNPELAQQDIPVGLNAGGVRSVYELESALREVNKPLEENRRAKRAGRLELADGLLDEANAAGWHNKKAGLQYSTETMERNIYDVVKDDAQAQKIIDTYFAPVHRHEADATRYKNGIKERVKALGLNKHESVFVQMRGELDGLNEAVEQGLYRNPAEMEHLELELVKYREKHGKSIDEAKVERAVPVFREIYDEVFQRQNEAYMANGYAPMPYRQGYFPHFAESADPTLSKIARALGIEPQNDNLPTDIAGLTQFFRPGRKWNPNAQQRSGFETEYNALKNMDRYLETAADVIYHTEDIQNLRALEDAIRAKFGKAGTKALLAELRKSESLTGADVQSALAEMMPKNGHLSGFVQELNEYTNILAGKKSRADRNIESDLGRAVYNTMKNLEGRVAANMVAVNPGSWLTNFIPIQQAAAETGTGSMARAMRDSLKNVLKNDGFASESTFLTNRAGTDRLTSTAVQKASEVMTKPMEWIDQFTAGVVTRAKAYDNIKNGMDRGAAIEAADAWAASVMADRSKGSMPTFFHRSNPLTKLFTMYQLEVNNNLRHMLKDMPRDARKKGVGALALMLVKYIFGAYLFNDLYEKLVGRRSAFDPLGIANEAIGDFTGYQLPNTVDLVGDVLEGNELDFTTEPVGATQAAAGLGENLAQELPFVGGLLGGGRIPVSSAIPDMGKVTGAATGWMSGETHPDKAKQTIGTEMAKLGYYFLPPFGGGQAKKVIEGAQVLTRGGRYTYDNEGNRKLQYAVEDPDVGDWAKAVIFGPSSLEEAQEWVKSDFKTESAKYTEAYHQARAAGVSLETFKPWWNEQRNIKADKDDEGKPISGSREAKLVDSVMGLDLTAQQQMVMLSGVSEGLADEFSAGRRAGVPDEDIVRWAYEKNLIQPDLDKDGKAVSGSKRQKTIDAAIDYSLSAEATLAMLDATGFDFAEEMADARAAGVRDDVLLDWWSKKGTIRAETGVDGKAYAGSKGKKIVNMAMSYGLPADQTVALMRAADTGFKEKFEKAAEVGVGEDSYLTYLATAAKRGTGTQSRKAVASALLYAGLSDAEKLAIFEMEEPDSKIRQAVEKGVSATSYLIYLDNADVNGNGSVNQEEAIAVLQAMDLTNEQRAVLFEMQNSKWKARPFG